MNTENVDDDGLEKFKSRMDTSADDEDSERVREEENLEASNENFTERWLRPINRIDYSEFDDLSNDILTSNKNHIKLLKI